MSKENCCLVKLGVESAGLVASYQVASVQVYSTNINSVPGETRANSRSIKACPLNLVSTEYRCVAGRKSTHENDTAVLFVRDTHE